MLCPFLLHAKCANIRASFQFWADTEKSADVNLSEEIVFESLPLNDGDGESDQDDDYEKWTIDIGDDDEAKESITTECQRKRYVAVCKES
jgi:hypothetical protein